MPKKKTAKRPKRKDKAAEAAATLVRKRWAKMTPEERSAHARKMNEARWGKPRKAN